MFDIRESTLIFLCPEPDELHLFGVWIFGYPWKRFFQPKQATLLQNPTSGKVKWNGETSRKKKPLNISLSHPHWLFTLVLPVFLHLEWVKIIIIVISKLKEPLICLLMSRDPSKSEIMYLILDTIICNLLMTDFMFGKIEQRKTFHETNLT